MKPSPKTRKAAQTAAFSTLTAALLYLAFRDIEWKTLWTSIRAANYYWLALGVALSILAYFVRAARWTILASPLGIKPSIIDAYRAVIIGYLANFAFPRLGEVARCGALARSSKLPFDKLVGSVVAERLFDLLCLILLMMSGVILHYDTFGQFLKDSIGASMSNFHLSTMLIAAIIVASAVTALLVYLLRCRKQHPLVQKAHRFLQGIAAGFSTIVKMQHRMQFLLLSFALWGCYWLMSWLMLYAIPAFGHLTAADGLLVMLLGSFGIVAPTNGGLGSFHAVIKYGMPVLFGVAGSDALAYAVLTHESQSVFVLLLGIIAYFKIFFHPKK